MRNGASAAKQSENRGGFYAPREEGSEGFGISGRITVSQHRKRLARDAQGLERGVFDVGSKNEAAGVFRGCGEPMEIQSELACNQVASTKPRLPMNRTPQAHTHRVWHNRASAAPAASFLPPTRKLSYGKQSRWRCLASSNFRLGDHPTGTSRRNGSLPPLGRSNIQCTMY